MKKTNRRIGLAVGCVVLFGAVFAHAQDWPQWRGANRDGKLTGFKAPDTWPSQLTEKWKVTVGSGDSTPALVGGKLYVCTRQGGEEVTLCLNAADGEEVWRDKRTAKPVTGAASRHPGPRSSPTVTGGKVVALGVDGVLSCLNAADGKVVWRKDEFKDNVNRFFTSMSPIVVDGMAVAHMGKAGNGALVAYDLASGDEKWRWTGEGPDYGSPALLTVGGVKQIVTLTEKSLVGIGAADGKLLWQRPFPIGRRAYNAATPIVDGQTVIYMGAGRGAKAVKIEKKGDGFAAVELWSNPDVAPQYNSPVLKDGLIFGFSDKGNLFCLDARTGKTAWVDSTAHGRGFAAVVDAGSVLLALPSTSELIAYKASGEKYEELAKIKVADTATYAHPVISGNRIFIKDQETLAMLTID